MWKIFPNVAERERRKKSNWIFKWKTYKTECTKEHFLKTAADDSESLRDKKLYIESECANDR
jgi:hypothetical protein